MTQATNIHAAETQRRGRMPRLWRTHYLFLNEEFFPRCPLRAAFVRDMKLRRYFAKSWIFWAKLILRVGSQRRQAIEHRGLSGCH